MSESNDAIRVSVEKLVITTLSGVSVDLSEIYTRLEIQESMASPAVSGRLELEDEQDQSELLPIIGQETLEVKLSIDDEFETYRFRVYKVGNFENKNVRRIKYTLFFTTRDEVTNENVLVRTSFSNTKYSDMVQRIMKDFVFSEKNVRVAPTLTTGTRIIPNIRPYKAINQLAANSVAEDGSTGYIFFEGLDSFYFTPVSAFAQNSPIYTYRFY